MPRRRHHDRGDESDPEGFEDCTILLHILPTILLALLFLRRPGFDPGRRDVEGRTLLLATCASSHGPDVPASALSPGARTRGDPPPSVSEPPLSLGADPLAVDAAGRNALHHASGPPTQTLRTSPAPPAPPRCTSPCALPPGPHPTAPASAHP